MLDFMVLSIFCLTGVGMLSGRQQRRAKEISRATGPSKQPHTHPLSKCHTSLSSSHDRSQQIYHSQ